MVCYLSTYDITIPSNADIYITQFTKLIEFDVLNPEGLIRIFDPGFKLKEFIVGKTRNQVSDDQEASIIYDLRIWIFAAIGFLVGVIVLALGIAIKNCRGKVKELLSKLKKKMVWNGVIRSLTISYVGIALTVSKQFKLSMKGSQFVDKQSRMVASMMTAYLILLPIAVFSFLKNKRGKLHNQEMKDKYGNFYA